MAEGLVDKSAGYGLSPNGGNIKIQGYHLIETKSTTLQNGEMHVCVGLDEKIMHDPNPNTTSVGEVADYIIIMPLNPALLRQDNGGEQDG